MSKKSEFLKFLNELLVTAPEETINKMSDDVKNYIEFLTKENDIEKPLFTENGKKILVYMRENQNIPLMKARDIAEGMEISSKTVSGAIRKLVSDGYVEKVGQDPTVYTLTENGKNIEIEKAKENYLDYFFEYPPHYYSSFHFHFH